MWLLAASNFLCMCPTINQLAVTLESDEKTVRKWAWRHSDLLTQLKMACTLSEISLACDDGHHFNLPWKRLAVKLCRLCRQFDMLELHVNTPALPSRPALPPANGNDDFPAFSDDSHDDDDDVPADSVEEPAS